MFKNAFRVGRFLALSVLLSAALSAPPAIVQVGTQLAAGCNGANEGHVAQAAAQGNAYNGAGEAPAPDA